MKRDGKCYARGSDALITELRDTRGVRGHILGSCLTCILRTARINNIEIVMCGDKCDTMENVKLGNEMKKMISITSFSAINLFLVVNVFFF